jgi:hypothetical protein
MENIKSELKEVFVDSYISVLDNMVENPNRVVIMFPGITPDAKYS